ncbi:hypothetical protein EXIGLDRAFT_476512 [Exidia glandulosa HHB12029]|uniref:DUF6535 domain-containing protein n=1 Tax=Exidia glandulosa HHB12029 TaxID=1314781 RepID=A0A165JUF2_EXIGL|nr:hypothetical protein EXIGLDRAFT_476512 [Exidia glandulosa HHB12029]
MRWRLPALISTLPLLLHIAVFLFAAGLVLLFITLDAAIAYVLLALTTALFCFYVTSILLAAKQLDCPFSTPLLDELRILAHSLNGRRWTASFTLLQAGCCVRSIIHLARLRSLATTSVQRLAVAACSTVETAKRSIPRFFLHAIRMLNGSALGESLPSDGDWTLQRSEETLIEKLCESGWDAVALRWMLRECSDPDVHAVASMAPAALHPASATATRLRENGPFLEEMKRCLTQRTSNLCSWTKTHAAEKSRVARAFLCLSQTIIVSDPFQLYESIYDLRLVTEAIYDPRSLEVIFPSSPDPAKLVWPGPRRYLTSTGLQVLSVPDPYWIKRTTRLRLIYGLDVQKLDASDLDFIVRTISDAFEVAPHTGHKLCDTACAVNLFCQLLEDPATYHIEDFTRPERSVLITHLLLLQPRQDFPCPEALSLDATKHIWLTSDFTPWPLRDLSIFVRFLTHILTPGIALSPSEDGAIVLRTLHRILAATRILYR